MGTAFEMAHKAAERKLAVQTKVLDELVAEKKRVLLPKIRGKYAVNGEGRIGRIKSLRKGTTFVGTGMDGKPWASRMPVMLAGEDKAILGLNILEEMA